MTKAMKLKDACSLGEKKKTMTNLDSGLKIRDITAEKSLYSQSYGFSSSYVQM